MVAIFQEKKIDKNLNLDVSIGYFPNFGKNPNKMDVHFTKIDHTYSEIRISFFNEDRSSISCFLGYIGKDKLSVLLRNAQIEFQPTKLSHFFFKFLKEKCYLYVIAPEGKFKLIEVEPFYIPRKNWQLFIAPLVMGAGDFNPILYANDVKK